ncbi:MULTISPECIES: TetR/AcrR family transcriptional regulator [unclassified Mesorhizobium]|uniref:TetR/AcrR family transcriptional regulator n=1 Tax=unclassified Mesorhizobium TaxID=325217 RepID=UPI003014D756
MSQKGRPRSFDRDEALRRAMRVFWQKGYDGASLSDLTAAMGINSPSLYAAFGCKEALFREAADLYSATEGVDIWKAFESPSTAREAMANFLRASAIAFSEPGDPKGCLIVLGALNPSDGNLEVFRDLSHRRQANVEDFKNRLKLAIEQDELPETIDCEAIAVFYLAVQQGMSIQARDGASRERLLSIGEGAMAAWDGLTSGSAGISPSRAP